MTIPIGQYMSAEPVGCGPHEVYAIYSRDGSTLGHAEWYPRWRGYVFSPDAGVVLSWDCCLAMARFLQCCNRGRTAYQTPLSAEAEEARRPPPPEELVGALQDRVHYDVGRLRAARSIRPRSGQEE